MKKYAPYCPLAPRAQLSPGCDDPRYRTHLCNATGATLLAPSTACKRLSASDNPLVARRQAYCGIGHRPGGNKNRVRASSARQRRVAAPGSLACFKVPFVSSPLKPRKINFGVEKPSALARQPHYRSGPSLDWKMFSQAHGFLALLCQTAKLSGATALLNRQNFTFRGFGQKPPTFLLSEPNRKFLLPAK